MSVLLNVQRLSKSFRGLRAVANVSFEVEEGAIVALIGPNGAGKTTIFNMVAGALRPDDGAILFAGKPIYVQRRELDDARTQEDYTIPQWVDAPGVQYVPVDGELELLPGLRLVPAPGHTPGMQMVVVETGGRPVIVGGDVAVWFGELDEPHTEGQLRVRALDPELVWLAHAHEPWRPSTA